MRPRPIGITIMAVLFAMNSAFYLMLVVLAVFNRHALQAVLHTLSPSGAGPEPVHTTMGRLLPLYYMLMAGVTTGLAIGFWKLWNWARIVVLAMTAVSLVFMASKVGLLLSAPTTAAIALTALRLGLCVLVGWYLLYRPVRDAFRQQRGKVAAV